jgi:hypothetical protein
MIYRIDGDYFFCEYVELDLAQEGEEPQIIGTELIMVEASLHDGRYLVDMELDPETGRVLWQEHRGDNRIRIHEWCNLSHAIKVEEFTGEEL